MEKTKEIKTVSFFEIVEIIMFKNELSDSECRTYYWERFVLDRFRFKKRIDEFEVLYKKCMFKK